MPSKQLEITHLFTYPIKSMKGISLDKAELTTYGLQHDRRWMVVRANGRFVTQREIPRLALIHTRFAAEGIELSMRDRGSITVPWIAHNGDAIDTRVWKDSCETMDQGEEIAGWLTSVLDSESPLKLVTMRPYFTRSLHQSGHLGEETSTYFADAAPFLVANQESLGALNAELTSRGLENVPMNRFRPNIVVRGMEAFEEHRVGEIATDDYAISLRYPCERCVVTTIDQDTAEKDPRMQPFKTLAAINPIPDNPRAPAFAENAVLTRGDGKQITVGDTVQAIFRESPPSA